MGTGAEIMLNWLLTQVVPLTLLLTALLLARPLALRCLGARWQYSLWLAVPLLLLWPLLPFQLTPEAEYIS
jgi:beta-lactamase regulating signal transducer with metallopeptidase domain